MGHIFHGMLGIAAIVGIAWGFGEARGQVRWLRVAIGLGVQVVLAVLLLKVPVFERLFASLNGVVTGLEGATREGTSMVFGYLGGGELPFDEKTPGGSFILAFSALPIVLVISALSSLLFYWRILPILVKGASRVLERTMGIGGALAIGAAANIFVGMVEAPLLVRPYLQKMTRSELFSVMTCGMATVAGTVIVLYAQILGPVLPNALGHILIASFISAPAALTVAQIMIPERGEITAGDVEIEITASSSMDAITQGTGAGLQLLLNICAMLVVLVALVATVNSLLGLGPGVGGEALTLERLLGWLMAPLVWLIGVPWAEAQTAGMLMGTKTVLNELVAFLDLVALPEDALSPRSKLIMTYSMCGFANPGSLGILLGGLCTMVPERRSEIVGLGLRCIVAATLATCLTGALVGMLS